jgi:uncharacterized protein YjbK
MSIDKNTLTLDVNINICSQCSKKDTNTICFGCCITVCESCRTELLCHICVIDEKQKDIDFNTECKIKRVIDYLSSNGITNNDLVYVKESLTCHCNKNVTGSNISLDFIKYKLTDDCLLLLSDVKDFLDGKSIFINLTKKLQVYRNVFSNQFSIKT